MQYKIIEVTEVFTLENEVDKAIKEGWKPQGGVSIAVLYPASAVGTIMRYAQAMIKE